MKETFEERLERRMKDWKQEEGKSGEPSNLVTLSHKAKQTHSFLRPIRHLTDYL